MKLYEINETTTIKKTIYVKAKNSDEALLKGLEIFKEVHTADISSKTEAKEV